ncbi:MAG: alpha/beta fold hydrolase [Dehalococcoidia bacterium]
MATSYPVRDIFVEANGIRHHLVARGAPGSPVVMMLHGLAGQARVFDSIANHLAAKYHVYCLDVRGRGESAWGSPDGYAVDTYVEDLEAVRDALGLQRMSLVGTSMGGLITMQYAPKHPERVAKAVLNDVGPEVDPKGLERILSYVGGAPEMFADLKAVIRYYKEHYAPMVEHMPDDQISEFARHNVRRSDTGVYVWKMDPAVRTTLAAPPAVTPWEALKGMTCPTLILRGANSDVLSADIAKRMLEALPGAKLVEVPGVGHAPVLSEPVSVKALDEFLG